MVPFTLPTRRLFLRVFWREVWFLTAMAHMCRHIGLVGLLATSREYGYLLAGMYSPPECYLSYYTHISGPARSNRDCVQLRTTDLERGVMLKLR